MIAPSSTPKYNPRLKHFREVIFQQPKKKKKTTSPSPYPVEAGTHTVSFMGNGDGTRGCYSVMKLEAMDLLVLLAKVVGSLSYSGI